MKTRLTIQRPICHIPLCIGYANEHFSETELIAIVTQIKQLGWHFKIYLAPRDQASLNAWLQKYSQLIACCDGHIMLLSKWRQSPIWKDRFALLREALNGKLGSTVQNALITEIIKKSDIWYTHFKQRVSDDYVPVDKTNVVQHMTAVVGDFLSWMSAQDQRAILICNKELISFTKQTTHCLTQHNNQFNLPEHQLICVTAPFEKPLIHYMLPPEHTPLIQSLKTKITKAIAVKQRLDLLNRDIQDNLVYLCQQIFSAVPPVKPALIPQPSKKRPHAYSAPVGCSLNKPSLCNKNKESNPLPESQEPADQRQKDKKNFTEDSKRLAQSLAILKQRPPYQNTGHHDTGQPHQPIKLTSIV